jgi:hypothetical protein
LHYLLMAVSKITTLEAQVLHPSRSRCSTTPKDLNNSNSLISLVTGRIIAVTNNFIKQTRRGKINTFHNLTMVVISNKCTTTALISDTIKAKISRDQMTGMMCVVLKCLLKDGITTFMEIEVLNTIKIFTISTLNKIMGLTIRNNIRQVPMAHSALSTGRTTVCHRTTMGDISKRRVMIIDSRGAAIFTMARQITNKSTAIPVEAPGLMTSCPLNTCEDTKPTSPIISNIHLNSILMGHLTRVHDNSKINLIRFKTKVVFRAALKVTIVKVLIIPKTAEVAKITPALT